MNSFSVPGYSALPVVEMANNPGPDINPDPIIVEEPDIMVNDFLSPTKLKEITGMEDLGNVTMMDMVVDTTETTLGNFGIFLPSLKQLKLSNSVIPTVRDVGTSLSHLSVLWLSCCGLQDVDGIASMNNLSELYLSYNDIYDISPISFLDDLQVLDLEGNKITDHDQFEYLTLLTKLRTLTLAGNPICQILNNNMQRTNDGNSENNSDSASITYRDFIMNKLPHIRYLDDERCIKGVSSQSSSDQQLSVAASSHSQEDIDLITTAIKEGLISEEDTSILPIIETEQTSGLFRPSSARPNRPGTATVDRVARNPESAMTLLSSRARPQTALPGGRSASAGKLKMDSVLRKSAMNAQRPSSSGSGDVSLEDESSILTFGEAICGNPIRALRSKKSSPSPVMSIFQNEEQKPTTQRTRPATANMFHQARFSSKPNDNQDDILQELKEWRAHHEDRISDLASADIAKLDRSSKDILLDSEDEATDSDVEEVLDLDELPGIQDDNNNNNICKSTSDKIADTGGSSKQVSENMEERVRLNNQFRGQMRSPPPKNLSPSSLSSSLSPRSSPVSPRSAVFSSSQFDSATVPVMRGGSSSPRSKLYPSSLQNKVTVKHMPAPPKLGAPRPRTAIDVRNLHLRRSLTGSTREAFVPLASPMTLPQALSANKQQTSNQIKQ